MDTGDYYCSLECEEDMNEQVERLVEWVARELYFDGEDYVTGSVAEMSWREKLPYQKQRWVDKATRILSHPDLALIDRELEKVKIAYNEMDIELCTCPPVIPLAEALKEEK